MWSLGGRLLVVESIEFGDLDIVCQWEVCE